MGFDILDVKEFIKDSAIYIGIFIVVFLLIVYVVGFSRVVGPSMQNSLNDGDITVISNFHYNIFDINRGDVISVRHTNALLIKRVVGLPGDQLRFEDGILYVNDEVYENENFIIDPEFNEVYEEIEEGYIFILGDNQTDSLDSRGIGPVLKENVDGKIVFRFFPFRNMGLVR